MLVRFSSIETESVTMFGDVALQLIRMLGGSGTVPGAIAAADIPHALKRLRSTLVVHKAQSEPMRNADQDDGDEKDKEPAIELGTRAGPLIDILERASAADAPVMWEKI